jgi:multidrug resistance efflux pump
VAGGFLLALPAILIAEEGLTMATVGLTYDERIAELERGKEAAAAALPEAEARCSTVRAQLEAARAEGDELAALVHKVQERAGASRGMWVDGQTGAWQQGVDEGRQHDADAALAAYRAHVDGALQGRIRAYNEADRARATLQGRIRSAETAIAGIHAERTRRERTAAVAASSPGGLAGIRQRLGL